MQKITTAAELRIAIQQLEDKQVQEWPLLKEQFLKTYESLNPFNMIKNSLKEFTNSTDVKDAFTGVAMGLTAGYISKLLVTGTSHNPIKKLFGNFLELGISNVVAKNSGAIKFLAGNLLDLLNKKEGTTGKGS